MDATEFRIELEELVAALRTEGVTAPITERLSTLVQIPLVSARLLAAALLTAIRSGLIPQPEGNIQ